ncbi:MAG: SapC family protein [Paraglaciecola sp.]|uniref:SapC family protein n=1 Tax=Paraglaciecola sp. TaxID=1920173 RepID=UPI0032987053
MTSTLELLDNVKHQKLRINNQLTNCKHNQTNTAAVTIGELSTLVHEYAIFISKSPESEQFQLVAILGLKSGENLYLKDNQWQATYLPLDILRRPFQAFVPDQSNLSEGRIAIDVSSEQVGTKLGQALFDEQGNPSAYLQKIQKTFAELMSGTEQTRALLEEANKLELIESVTLNIELANQEKASLNGLYAFNKDALTKLSGAKLEKAHQSGVLQVSHLLLSSTLHLQKLINWSSQ